MNTFIITHNYCIYIYTFRVLRFQWGYLEIIEVSGTFITKKHGVSRWVFHTQILSEVGNLSSHDMTTWPWKLQDYSPLRTSISISRFNVINLILSHLNWVSSSITNISLTYHSSTEAVANRQPNQSQPLDRFLPKEPPLDRPAAPRFPRRGPVSPATLPLTSPRRSPSLTGSAGRPSFND